MPFQHLIWDFDGTLFDTYPAINASVCDALAEHGVKVDPEFVADLLVETLGFCIETLAMQHDLDPEQLRERTDEIRSAVPLSERPPFEGAMRICRRAQEDGRQNHIVTHRVRDSLMSYLTLYKVDGLFADIITADDGYPRKPNPASIVALIDRNKIPRVEALYIGDRKLDVLAAQKAGIKACLYSHRTPDGFSPDFQVVEFDELWPILELDPV